MISVVIADVEVGNGRDSTQDVVWGPLVFEARRFVELRKKSLWQQFLSAESFGMGLFYTLNVSSLLTKAHMCSLGNMHGHNLSEFDVHGYTNLCLVIRGVPPPLPHVCAHACPLAGILCTAQSLISNPSYRHLGSQCKAHIA